MGIVDSITRGILETTVGEMKDAVLDALPAIGGLAIGVVIVQAALEVLWRLGLRLRPAEPLQIRLARQAAAHVRGAAPAPADHRRRLIICCDGTWNSPVQNQETNVVQLLRAIKPLATVADNLVPQIAYYHL
jgi:hypothetical protein